MNNNNLTCHPTSEQTHNSQENKHQTAVLWLTGLSGAGKSTLANAVASALHQLGCRTKVLDGDNMRHRLCQDLGFSNSDRRENNRRCAEVSKLFIEAGYIVLSASISPFEQDRKMARAIISPDHFIEIYCCCSLEICEQRDSKGLYRLAKAGDIDNFTGISSPYEQPKAPEIMVQTGTQSVAECVAQIIKTLHAKGIIKTIDKVQ